MKEKIRIRWTCSNTKRHEHRTRFGAWVCGRLQLVCALLTACLVVLALTLPALAIDRGGSITTGGTSQQVAAANQARRALIIQNPCTATEQGISAAENLYINVDGAATVNTNANFAVLTPCSSITLGLSGGVMLFNQFQANATTTGHIYYAKEFQ